MGKIGIQIRGFKQAETASLIRSPASRGESRDLGRICFRPDSAGSPTADGWRLTHCACRAFFSGVMPTYVYETIPGKPGETLRRFEMKQSMKDKPLTRDPESGLPVRRVISGGFAPLMGGAGSESGCDNGQCAMPEPPRHGCGPSCGCV